jgi:DeoR/GlpR family transcriptional regulator of sugar metabolism
MLDAARVHLLLVDSSKFGRHAPFSHRDVSAYDAVITDRGVPQSEKKAVRRLGTRLLLVDAGHHRPTAPAPPPSEPFPTTSPRRE